MLLVALEQNQDLDASLPITKPVPHSKEAATDLSLFINSVYSLLAAAVHTHAAAAPAVLSVACPSPCHALL